MITNTNKYVLKLTIFSVDSQFYDDKIEINLIFDAPYNINGLKICCYSDLKNVSEIAQSGWICPKCGNRFVKKRKQWRVKVRKHQ